VAQLSVPAYDVILGWEQLPPGYAHAEVPAVAVASDGRVYLFCRGEHPVMIYERDGTFVASWGEGIFTMRAHGITIAPDETLWCTDEGDHTVRQFTRAGDLLLTLGTSGIAADTGYNGKDISSIARGGPPFNRPTNLAVAPSGDLYVSDGYGNARVHQFSPQGELIRSWGEPGTGPGQFMLPHGIAVHHDGRVFVCDRENDRIQIFNADGEYLEQWNDVPKPMDLVFDPEGFVFIAEGRRRHAARLTVRDERGVLVAQIGDRGPILERGATDPCAPGNFCAPHGIALGPDNELYVGETTAGSVEKGHCRPDCHVFQKFSHAL
jgi:DNA-binding beta-propeller fold protein YncE